MSAYVPRPGSKVEQAANELKQGPKSVDELARFLSVKRSNVAVLLRPACRHAYLCQYTDAHGIAHWALSHGAAEAANDCDSPRRALPGWPQVRNIIDHAPPSDEARRYADPFGRTKGWTAHA